MPHWASRPFNPYMVNPVTNHSRSETGQHLEAIVKYRNRVIDLNFKSLTVTWWEANGFLFETEHCPELFGFVWDETNHPNDCLLARKKGDSLNTHLNPNSIDWSFSMEGLHE